MPLLQGPPPNLVPQFHQPCAHAVRGLPLPSAGKVVFYQFEIILEKKAMHLFARLARQPTPRALRWILCLPSAMVFFLLVSFFLKLKGWHFRHPRCFHQSLDFFWRSPLFCSRERSFSSSVADRKARNKPSKDILRHGRQPSSKPAFQIPSITTNGLRHLPPPPIFTYWCCILPGLIFVVLCRFRSFASTAPTFVVPTAFRGGTTLFALFLLGKNPISQLYHSRSRSKPRTADTRLVLARFHPTANHEDQCPFSETEMKHSA